MRVSVSVSDREASPTDFITVLIPRSLHQEIKIAAIMLGITLQVAVEQALREWISRCESENNTSLNTANTMTPAPIVNKQAEAMARLAVRLPYFSQIAAFDFSEPDALRFVWRGHHLRVAKGDCQFSVDEVDGHMLAGTDFAMLLKALLDLP